MADYEFCKVDRDGHLTVVTLNRPEVMNALHPPAHFELAEVFDDFAADPDQWVGDRDRRGRAGLQRRQRSQIPGLRRQDVVAAESVSAGSPAAST